MSHDPHADPDMFRRPCPHRWVYHDTLDLFVCRDCKATESPDDEPKGAA